MSGTHGAELDELGDGLKVVPVSALLGTGSLENVGDQVGVTDLLLSHETDQVSLIGVDTVLLELGVGESGETVVEEVELDPLLAAR